MSLINDALKRAKQSHETHTPPPFRGAPLHAESAHPAKSSLTPVLLGAAALFAALIAVTGFLLVRPTSYSGKLSATVAALPTTSIESRTAPVPPPTVTPPTHTVEAAQPLPPASQPTVPAAEQSVSATPINAVTESTEIVVTTAIQPEPAAQSAPNARLQGILYNPTRPAAIINGRTLYVGDRLKDIRVVAITPGTATVLWNDQTYELELER